MTIVFIPALIVILVAKEREAGRALTQQDVESIRDEATAINLPDDVAESMTVERGYSDIDPENVWREWQNFKSTNAEEFKMVVCEFLMFGHGRDGEIRSCEYDNSGKLEFTSRATQLLASGSDGFRDHSYQAVEKKDTYIVTAHQSKNDGQTYLIATEDGILPSRIDDRIRAAANLKSSPF